MSEIRLSDIKDRQKKLQLINLAGYEVVQNKSTGHWSIPEMADCFDNDFRSLNELLLAVKKDLYCKGFNIIAA